MTGVYFLNLNPPLADWCLINIEILHSQQASINNLQPHVIRCRELIFTETEIFATPHLHSDKTFDVILTKALHKNGRLQLRLKKLGLACGSPVAVTTSQLEACMRYTIQARMSPSWNSLKSYFVRGREFLQNVKSESVKIELNVCDNQICIDVTPLAIKLLPLKLSDVVTSEQALQQFQCSRPWAILDQSHIGAVWCHVLPSMKKSLIVDIRHVIPNNAPFQSYSDIKKYWKNIYGYRLPDSDDDIFYIQVCFRPFSTSIFTYPSCCVRLNEPVTFSRSHNDSAAITVCQAFISDVTSRLPVQCSPCLAQHPVTKLHKVNQTVVEGFMPNLASPRTPPIAVESIESTCGVFDRNAPANSVISTNLSGDHVRMSTECRPAAHTTDVNVPKRVVPVFTSNVVRRMHNPVVANKLPIDKDRSIQMALNQTTSTSSQSKQCPLQTSKLPSFFGSNSASRTNHSNVVSKPSGTSAGPGCKRLNVSSNQRHRSPVKLPSASWNSGPSITQDDGRFKVNPPAGHKSHVVNVAHQVHEDALQRNISTVRPFHRSPQLSPRVSTGTHISGHIVQPTPSNKLANNVSAQSSAKRKQDDKTVGNTLCNEVGAKKPRTKPQIQHNVDIETIIKTDRQLTKVNSTTLIAWLRERGISVKSKDKKTDLVSKVLHTLHLSTIEQ